MMNESNISLFTGTFGLLINGLMCNDPQLEELIDVNINKLENNSLMNTTFCTGISGSLWVLLLLKRADVIEFEEGFFTEIDNIIQSYTKKLVDLNNLDFLHGAMGNVFYLVNNMKNHFFLSKLIMKINSQRKQFRNKQVFFYENFPDPEKYIQMKISLGLSHGLPGFIVVFTKLYNKNIQSNLCKEIVQDQINFILELENPNRTIREHAFYPTSISLEDEHFYSSRLAWCYGDLGIAMAFYISGDILREENWKNKAFEIFDYYIEVKGDINAGIVDAGICHGVAGVALIYYCIHYKTKNEKYFKEAKYWLSELEQYQIIDKLGNITYGSYSHETKSFEKNETFLEGTCGVEIVINTITNKLDPSWAECLLIY
ncbi:MAG: lanthionine synthetase LanC family protein [Flavobacteriales bacterium]